MIVQRLRKMVPSFGYRNGVYIPWRSYLYWLDKGVFPLLFFVRLTLRHSRINEEEGQQTKIKMCDKFYEIYETVKAKHRAPGRFVSLIDLYVRIYLDKLKNIMSEQKKLQVRCCVSLKIVYNWECTSASLECQNLRKLTVWLLTLKRKQTSNKKNLKKNEQKLTQHSTW